MPVLQTVIAIFSPPPSFPVSLRALLPPGRSLTKTRAEKEREQRGVGGREDGEEVCVREKSEAREIERWKMDG